MNLKIALNSILGRYPDLADGKVFFPEGTIDLRLLPQINRKRREHHYNYLSMNEIFNMPPTKASLYKVDFFRKFRDFVSKSLFALPFFSYLLVAANDYVTLEKGMVINPIHTAFNFSFTLAFTVVLLYLTTKNILIEKRITHEYEIFHRNYCASDT
jgi:hypothetical protein